MIKIGVCDSGLGGLSILHKVWICLPDVASIYVADSKYAPYGNKDSVWIQKRIINVCHFLSQQNVQAIVIACNTATTHAVQQVREHIQHIPIIGVEPGVKPGIQHSKNKRIGILATYNTLNSASFKNLLQRLNIEQNNSISYVQQIGYGLVECIEQGPISLGNVQLVTLCHTYMQYFIAHNVDTVVLGCTHYPFLLPILNMLYPDIIYIETAEAVVKQLSKKLYAFINKDNLHAGQHKQQYQQQYKHIKHIMYSTLNAQHLKLFVEQTNINNDINNNVEFYKLDDLPALN